MGNVSSGISTPTLTPTTSNRSNRPFTFKANHNNIYNEILKDAQKLKLQDKKNDYNPHRRAESIALNLPKQLQSYSNAIHIVNEFWLDHIENLPQDELNKLVMVLYCHLYLKCKDMRSTLLIAQKNNIGSHATKIFHVFSYVIRNLIHPSNHLKLFRQLQALGTVHRSYSLTNENYEAMLEAFNFAMEEKFANNYRIRTRFCFSQIYRVIVDIMTGEDFYSFAMRQFENSNINDDDEKDKADNNKGNAFTPLLRATTPILKRLSSARGDSNNNNNNNNIPHLQAIHGVDTSSSSLGNINDNDLILDDDELNRLQSLNKYKRSSTQRSAMMNQIDGFLGSLEECLCDEIGSLYFKKYLEEQFCVENYLFHEAVLKYKSAKSIQRIKLGEEIIEQFVEIGSEKEVNLSYNTRKQIVTIVNLVKKMNDNKEKYQQLLSTKQNNKNKSIMNEDDIKYLKKSNKNKKNGHYRMATTKKLPLELAEITSDANENIQDVVYSMGYTQSLFDKAYDEIFNLMRTNSWNTFRNAILEYCGDDEFVKQQKEKLEARQQEKRSNLSMIQAINSITRSHRKYTATSQPTQPIMRTAQISSNNQSSPSSSKITTNGKTTLHSYHKQKSIQDILNGGRSKNGAVIMIKKKEKKQTRFRHKRNGSKDDFDLNYSTQDHAHYSPSKHNHNHQNTPTTNHKPYKYKIRKKKIDSDIGSIIDESLSPSKSKQIKNNYHRKKKINKNKNTSISYSKATRVPLHERFDTKSSIIRPLSELRQVSFENSSILSDAEEEDDDGSIVYNDYDEYNDYRDEIGQSDDSDNNDNDKSVIIKKPLDLNVYVPKTNYNHIRYNHNGNLSDTSPTSQNNHDDITPQENSNDDDDDEDIITPQVTDFNENDIQKKTLPAYSAISEDREMTIKINSFNNKPARLSFVPKLIPSIEKSVTSPTVQMNSTYSVRKMTTPDMTPGGGAAVAMIQPIQTMNNHISSNGNNHNKDHHIPNFSDNGSYSPSELFTLVSSALPEHNPNRFNPNHYNSNQRKTRDITRKRSSGIYKNGSKPLYAQHKKRKSKSKRNSMKRATANFEDTKSF